jgi:hypothetical protein
LCGPKDLCNRAAYELHAGCIDPSPRNAAQDDDFTGGACFGIDVRFAIDLLCGHGFHLRALHSRREAQAEEPATKQPVCRCLSAKGVLAGTFLRFQRLTTKKRVEKLRYMHRNPLKRGLVDSPEQWLWSSYRFYLLGETGAVRVNVGWTAISFRGRIA